MTRSVEEILGDDWRDEMEVAPDPYGFIPLTQAERTVIAQLLPPAEVARRLGLSRQRVDELLRNGPLPAVWIGVRRVALYRHVERYAEVEKLPRPRPRRRKRIESQPPEGRA